MNNDPNKIVPNYQDMPLPPYPEIENMGIQKKEKKRNSSKAAGQWINGTYYPFDASQPPVKGAGCGTLIGMAFAVLTLLSFIILIIFNLY